jgi:predicted nucleic acid-binding protein
MSGEKKYLLDTNAIIAILADKVPAIGTLRVDPLIAISVITEIELLSFSRLSINEETGIKAFLETGSIIYINPDIKDISIQLRRKHGIKTLDAIIAATAINYKALLVTDDRVLLRLKECKAISTTHFSEIIQ